MTVRQLRNRRTRLVALAAGVLSLGLVAAACGGGGGGGSSAGGGSGGGGGGKDKTITIGYITWAEDVATTYMWENILENHGYTVETKQLQAGGLFTGMAKGDLDFFLDTWLPTTHKSYWKQYGDQLEKLAMWYDNASLDLAVPKYWDVNSIDQLGQHASEIDGKITGIDAGAGESDQIKNNIIPSYGFEGTIAYAPSSEATMLASLKKAIGNKQPIVVALWHPHWAYAAFPIKDLKDPKNAWPGAEKIYVTARGDFSKDHPEIAKWFKNYKLSDQQLASLEDQIFQVKNGEVVNKAENPQERKKIIDKWIDKHQDLVDSWTGGSGSSD